MRSRGEVAARISCFGSTPKSTRAASSQSSVARVSARECRRRFPRASASSRKTASARSMSSSDAGSPSSTHLLDDACLERASARQLEQAEALAALDDDVHAPVLELFENARDTRARPDLVNGAVARREHEPELDVTVEALLHQLVVARLEDVQWDPLGRDEDEREREETELGHAGRVRARTVLAQPEPWLSLVRYRHTRHTHARFCAVGSQRGGGRGHLGAPLGHVRLQPGRGGRVRGWRDAARSQARSFGRASTR